MKTWFITGAGGGFGLKIGQQALAAGDKVLATARNPHLEAHPNLLTLSLDVTDEAQARQVAEAAIQRFGRIDVLVNNAGFSLLGAVEEANAEEVELLYRTNVFGLLAVTRAVLPYMRARRSGHILNFSSLGGYRARAGAGVYCSTKFAVEGLSEALAAELKPLGIQVTIVQPGCFRSDFLEASSLLVSATHIDDYTPTAGHLLKAAQTVNQQQPGDPDKLAQIILRLAGHPQAPLRLALGGDTLAAIEAKNRSVQEEMERWRDWSLSTGIS